MKEIFSKLVDAIAVWFMSFNAPDGPLKPISLDEARVLAALSIVSVPVMVAMFIVGKIRRRGDSTAQKKVSNLASSTPPYSPGTASIISQ